MSEPIRLVPPLSEDDIKKLRAGDRVLISGTLYTARDAAHKRLIDLLDEGKDLPFDIRGRIIYYVGPAPAKPGNIIGSAGPTTSYRMDSFAPRLMEAGMRGMIGKGNRDRKVIEAGCKFGCVYFAAIGGAGALISKSIRKVEIIAYEELGPEAVRRMEVEDFEVIVVNDVEGNDLYEQGKKEYAVG